MMTLDHFCSHIEEANDYQNKERNLEYIGRHRELESFALFLQVANSGTIGDIDTLPYSCM